jgi:hypothetical protein
VPGEDENVAIVNVVENLLECARGLLFVLRTLLKMLDLRKRPQYGDGKGGIYTC